MLPDADARMSGRGPTTEHAALDETGIARGRLCAGTTYVRRGHQRDPWDFDRAQVWLPSSATMLRLNRRQREVLIEKMPDVANLVAAFTFLGQLLTDPPFSLRLALGGIAGWTLLWMLTLLLAEKNR